MVYWHEAVLLYITSLIVRSYGVDPACDCVVFQSYGLSQGQFISPNYPEFYKRGINCILYTFIGDVNEIIEITFVDLDLKAPIQKSPLEYICKDRLRIFQNLHRPEVNEHSISDLEICGNISDLEQKKYYSKDRGLVLEFHTDTDSFESHKGFKGIFKFLDKSAFKIDGDREPGTQCTYYFQSVRNQSTGFFYSPRYPQNYPKASNCRYIFFGHKNERVRIVFKNIQLPKSRRCDDSGDRIIVHDGRDNSQKVIGEFCDSHNQEVINSSGADLYVEFKSDRTHERKGFVAEYQFIDEHSAINDSGDKEYTPITPNFICNDSITSRVSKVKNGTVTSPRYPDPYPSSISCVYEFEGEGQERVQLRFVEMNLYYTGRDPKDPYDCVGQDSITVIVYIAGKESTLGTYCGQAHPPQYMSNGPRMKVVFTSINPQKGSVSGFKLNYSFRTDFGVRGTGEQDPRKGGCNFYYNSSAVPTGLFTSPNYPGNYPNDCICNYYFYGKSGEHVNITFETFHLSDEGLLSLSLSVLNQTTHCWYSKEPSRRDGSFEHQHCMVLWRNLKNIDPSFCTFMFRSSGMLQGQFTSPNYNGIYPRNTECHYIFYGKKNEQVKITFTEFDVDGIVPRCDDTTLSDTVSFSNFLNTEDRKMQPFCGKRLPGQEQVTSDGAFFRATFKSNHIYDAKGFKGVYAFTTVDKDSITPTVVGPANHGSRSYSLVTVTIATIICQTVIFLIR